jgi:dolichol-phosphate mannosyltransferase
LLDRRVHTYTCLFRAYRRDVIDHVSFQSDGFLGVTEILANALVAGYTVRELPCTLRARRYGQSKARVARIILSHLRFQARLVSSGAWWTRSRRDPLSGRRAALASSVAPVASRGEL